MEIMILWMIVSSRAGSPVVQCEFYAFCIRCYLYVSYQRLNLDVCKNHAPLSSIWDKENILLKRGKDYYGRVIGGRF